MTVLRIAQSQINPIVGDLRGNTEKIIHEIGKARDQGSHLVTFPELALTGYPPEDLLLRKRFLTDCRSCLDEIAINSYGIASIVGFPELSEGSVGNSAALIVSGKIAGVYHKMELPNYGVFDERRYFRPGEKCFVFRLNGIRFSLTICEDIWVPKSATEFCAIRNCADVVINISGSPFFAGKYEIRKAIASRFAKSVDCFVFFNNLVGGQDELVFDGGSFVIDRIGELISSGKRFCEDLLITDVEISPKPKPATLWNMNESCEDISLHFESKSGPRQPPRLEPELGEIEEIYLALTLGLRDYVEKNGFDKVVIGLSGGVDSALVLAIAVEALGADRVVGVTMPSEFTSAGTLSDAGVLAQNFTVRLLTVSISSILKSFLSSLREVFGPKPLGLESENLQARIRGAILMALSNRFGWLVLTTGNKSETAVGYCTLYGDTAGGFAVIKDVPKTLVYKICDHVNGKAGFDIIPDSILTRPPTAELRPNQKDEDSLPPYHMLDAILKLYVEEDMACEDIKGFPPQMVSDVARMVDRNEYKRRQAPPGVKITPKAFGKDRRLPLTCKQTNFSCKEK
jgi:NAD+ synthase (glutamine-hydrolysing)